MESGFREAKNNNGNTSFLICSWRWRKWKWWGNK